MLGPSVLSAPSLCSGVTSWVTTTNITGHYEFDNLSPGMCSVVVSPFVDGNDN